MTTNIDSLYQEDWLIRKSLETIFLQSRLLLDNKFNHAFFTNKKIENNPESLNKLLCNNSSIHFLHQIHSKKVVNASQSNYQSIQRGDSLISDKHLQSLWIYTADCIPILLGDINRGNVAAIHSGWKGLAKNNIKSTITKLEDLGSNKKDLVVALGPAISKENYIVGEEVVSSIYESLEPNQYLETENILDRMTSLECLKINKDKTLAVDIRKAAQKQLIMEGLEESQISINKNCTFSEEKLFNSWRRDKTSSRQWSFIEAR